MQYREDICSGGRISALGFGCMRLPKESESERLILRALDLGINYFDTAYLYAGNEEMLGRIMARNGIRDRMLLATKLPHGKCRAPGDTERLFTTSCERLQTPRIDYYLLHNLVECAQWERLCGLGVDAWLAQLKAEGRIGAAGFSFHGSTDEFLKILNAYDWDFCQIQYNYSNENFQAGRAGLLAAAERGIPVIIMEPLLGGKLAGGLPKKAQAALREADPQASLASWGLRWLWDQPQVTCVLSGMNTLEQLEDNAAVASATLPNSMTPAQHEAIEAARTSFEAAFRIPCTGCNYCMPCPKGINIPAAFAAYNSSYNFGWFTGIMGHMMSANVMDPNPHFARSCVNCGACKAKCPQHIDVPTQLRAVRKRLEPGIAIPAVKLFAKIHNK
ncbi:MAG: aldo/keto reductase [Coriobacteriia bacterium]|nr:aldo/keto reductase [Coriobacteriia bacterium]